MELTLTSYLPSDATYTAVAAWHHDVAFSAVWGANGPTSAMAVRLLGTRAELCSSGRETYYVMYVA